MISVICHAASFLRGLELRSIGSQGKIESRNLLRLLVEFQFESGFQQGLHHRSLHHFSVDRLLRLSGAWTGKSFLLNISLYLYKLMFMDDLDSAFSALADPTRRAILGRLALGEATVTELAKPFEMTQPAISQHLKVLEDAGLIERRVDGTKRPRRLAKAGIAAMDQWLAMLRKALDKNYDRLDEVLSGMEQKKRGKKR